MLYLQVVLGSRITPLLPWFWIYCLSIYPNFCFWLFCINVHIWWLILGFHLCMCPRTRWWTSLIMKGFMRWTKCLYPSTKSWGHTVRRLPVQLTIAIANCISHISDKRDVKAWVKCLLCTRNKNFTFSCVTYLNCVISLRVEAVPMYCDPRSSCFTLHKRMKNSDGSEEEI